MRSRTACLCPLRRPPFGTGEPVKRLKPWVLFNSADTKSYETGTRVKVPYSLMDKRETVSPKLND